MDVAENLPKNKDFLGSNPDVYILVNTFRKVGKQERVYTTARTRIVSGNTDPVFEELLRMSSVGSGLIVINVMSSHTMGSDTIIGQAILDLEKYCGLYSSCVQRHIRLPLKEMSHDVHDTTGEL